MIWISSDWHYWHKNMTYGESVWSNKETTTRRFDTTQEMSRKLVENINKYIKEDDEIYFLGDFAFSGIENIWNFRKQIICKNIHFIPGNHDQHIKNNKTLPNVWENIKGGYVEKIPEFNFRTVYSQDLFDYLPELVTIIYNKQKFILSHYPLDQWEDMDRGSIMLHGHCHGKINDCETNTLYKRMDVGIDWNEFRPYTLDEIIEIMSTRQTKKHLN